LIERSIHEKEIVGIGWSNRHWKNFLGYTIGSAFGHIDFIFG
jgi:hypothetical protein